jgi:uncharacterized membrane protein
MEGENQMSDTSETVTYHLSVLVIVDGGMRPATQITITRYDRATVQSYGNLGAIPPVFE